jgi:hypothetical protein
MERDFITSHCERSDLFTKLSGFFFLGFSFPFSNTKSSVVKKPSSFHENRIQTHRPWLSLSLTRYEKESKGWLDREEGKSGWRTQGLASKEFFYGKPFSSSKFCFNLVRAFQELFARH